MIPKQAIEKAIEGGYEAATLVPQKAWLDSWFQNQIALDPTFWQALGSCSSLRYGKCLNKKQCSDCGKGYGGTNPKTWLKNAHRFYDLILTGGDTEQYWKDILK